MSGEILTPGEGDGLLFGPDGKTKVKAPPPPTTDRKVLRRQKAKLCQRCGKLPHRRKLPNRLKVCNKCYFTANPQGAERLAAYVKAKKEGRLAPPD